MNKKRRDIKKAREQEEAAAKAPRTLTITRSGLTEEQLRAVGVGVAVKPEAVTAMTSGMIKNVALENIDDNPWQPRTTADPAALRDLADNIAQVGLLQSPVGRNGPDGHVQLAFGHRRVAAIRLLAAEGKWDGPVPVSVRALTDASMAILALSENKKRKDITPLEEYRAYKKVLDEIKGLTVASLADSIGLDRSTLSNNLRILQLPAVVLDRFASGELSGHAAREFLCLMNDTHVHEEEMAAVIKDITSRGLGSAPDWRTENVRRLIRYHVAGNEETWRPLASKEGDVNQSNESGGGWREPSFDVDAFVKEHAASVHTIPAAGKAPSRLWTCDMKEWRRRQTSASRQLNMEVREGKGGQGATLRPGTPEADAAKDIKAVLAKDPVLAQFKKTGTVAPILAGFEATQKDLPGKPLPGLTKEEAAVLGTRARAIDEYRHGGFKHELGKEDIPAWFPDVDECLKRCTWGASYMTSRYNNGGKPVLACLNEKHFRAKMAGGLEAFQAQLKKTSVQEDAEDMMVASAVSLVVKREGNALKGLAVALLVGKEHFEMAEPLTNTPGVDYELQRRIRYERLATRSARLLLGLGKEAGAKSGGFTVTDKVLQAVGKMDSEKLRSLVGHLVAHLLREVGWKMAPPSAEALAHEEPEAPPPGVADTATSNATNGQGPAATPIVVGDKVRLPMPGGKPYTGVYLVEAVEGNEAVIRIDKRTTLRYAVKALAKVEPAEVGAT